MRGKPYFTLSSPIKERPHMGKIEKNHCALSCWRIDLGNWERNWEWLWQVHLPIVSNLNLLLNELKKLVLPFQITSPCLLIDVLTFHFTWILFIWSHSLDPSLVVYLLCRWSQADLEDITKAPSISTCTRTSLPYQVHHIFHLSFTLNKIYMLHWIDSFANTFYYLEY